MTDTISAAQPSALFRYAEVAARINAHLEAESARLTYPLNWFAASCTEYQLGINEQLAHQLHQYAQSVAERDAQVREVARAFEWADRSSPIPDDLLQWLLPGPPSSPQEYYDWAKNLRGGKNLAFDMLFIRDGRLRWGKDLPRDLSAMSKNLERVKAWLKEGKQRGRPLRTSLGATYSGQVILYGSHKVRDAAGLPRNLTHLQPSAGGMVNTMVKSELRGWRSDQKAPIGKALLGVDVALAGWENWHNYKDEDAESRAAKVAVGTAFDTALSVGGAAAGTAAGAALGGLIGSALGPGPGTVVGGVVGGRIGGLVGGWVGGMAAKRIIKTDARDAFVDTVAQSADNLALQFG